MDRNWASTRGAASLDWPSLRHALRFPGEGELLRSEPLLRADRPRRRRRCQEPLILSHRPSLLARSCPRSQRPVPPALLKLQLRMDTRRGSLVHGLQTHKLAGKFYPDIRIA